MSILWVSGIGAIALCDDCGGVIEDPRAGCDCNDVVGYCDACDKGCQDLHGNEDHKVCCVCLQRSYDRNAPKGWRVEMCGKCGERR